MPDPTCPHEDCTETVTHWHAVPDGEVFICPRTKGGRCLLHVDHEIGCYAPRTQPNPLDALLAAARDAKRSHDRLRDLAETLLPAAPAPAEDDRIAAWEAVAEHPIFAPCYDNAAPLLLSMLDRLDGLNAQPAAQPIDPADLKPGDEFVCTYRYLVDSLGDWGPSEKHGQATEYHLLGHSDPDAALIADLRQYVTSATSDDELRDMIAAVRKTDDARADQ